MPGNNTVIVDTDALVGLIHTDDTLHTRCVAVATYLEKNNFATVIPGPIILEAATVLSKDKTIKRPDLAKRLLQDYARLTPPSLDARVFPELARAYDPLSSRKNTPFDFFVLTAAYAQNITIVFSFDVFYKKHGLTLAEELLR